MNRLFDTSVNVGLRQFYVLGAAGSIGNLFGFVGNVYIYGLSAPTIFCALCTLVIFATHIRWPRRAVTSPPGPFLFPDIFSAAARRGRIMAEPIHR